MYLSTVVQYLIFAISDKIKPDCLVRFATSLVTQANQHWREKASEKPILPIKEK